MSLIDYAVDGTGVATITFQRDEKRNAINREMAGRILQCLDEAARDARVVILRARPGATVWCAGHDLAELDPQALHANPTLDILRTIQSVPVPVLAMVEGAVYGGGLLLLLSADIVVAARNASAAITSNKLGIPLPPELYAYWLRVIGLHKTKELLFTASALTAEDAWNAGLYNHLVELDQLERVTRDIADKILACSAEAVANAKHQLNAIATQTGLGEPALADITEQNARLLQSSATRQRILDLLARVQKEP